MQLKAGLDLDKKVEFPVFDKRNAGRNPGTRWGRVQFDAEGHGKVKALIGDAPKLMELGWLTPDVIAELYDDAPEASPVSDANALEAMREMESSLREAGAYIEKLRGELAAAEQKALEAETRATAAEGKVTAAQGALDDAKGQIKKLQDELAAATSKKK